MNAVDLNAVFRATDKVRARFDAMEARRAAHMIRACNLPGWRIHYRMQMQRAIRKWQRYAELKRGAS